MNLSPRMFMKSILLPLGILTMTACAPQGPDLSQIPPPGTTQVYECRGDYEFLAQFEGDSAQLFLPDRTVTLVRQSSADGVKYSRGDVAFWLWDDEAMLEIGQESRRTCILNTQRKSLK